MKKKVNNTKEKNEILIYHNDFNSVVLGGLSKNELNFLMAICYKVLGKSTNTVSFSFKELAKISNFRRKINSEEFEKMVLETNAKLQGKSYSLKEILDSGKIKTTQFVLFPTFETNPDTLTLTVEVHKKFEKLLNTFNENFTEVDLKKFVTLKSKYSQLIYRELMQYKSNGYRIIKLDELVEKLNIPTSYYSIENGETIYKITLLKTRILDKVKEELKQKLEDFNYEFKSMENRGNKKGRKKFTHIEFTFKPIKYSLQNFQNIEIAEVVSNQAERLQANNEEIDIKEEERLFNLDSIKCGLDMQISITEEEIETEKSKIERYKQYIKQTREAGAIDNVDEVINRDIINHYEFCIKEALEKIRSLEAKIIEDKEEIEKIENEIACNHSESNQTSINNEKDIEIKEEIDYLKLMKEFLVRQNVDYRLVEAKINILLENNSAEEIYREILRINSIKDEKANIDPRKYLIASINNIEKIKNVCNQSVNIQSNKKEDKELKETKFEDLLLID